MISDNQAGFRQGFRTTDQIYILKTILNKYLHKSKKPVFGCFVDFSKAFDSVWRDALFYKMNNLGISGNIFQVIKNMYSNTHICIKKNDIISEPVKTSVGVKQGDSLSSTLFNLYLHDIDKCFNDTNKTDPVNLEARSFNHLLFADDLLLFSESSSGLQNCLDKLYDYCEQWKLKINFSKTKIIIFSKGKKDFKKFQFWCGNSEIEIVERYKYLGVVFTYNGNMKHSADELYKKGLKAFFKLKSQFLNFENIPIKISLKLFDTLIRPIITYGCEIWFSDYKFDLKNINNLNTEKLHHKMLKTILGVKRQTSNLACRLECKKEPVLIYIMSQMYKFYYRLAKLDNNRILYNAYLTDCRMYQEKSKSGINNIIKSYEYIGKEFDNFSMEPSEYNKLLLKMFGENEGNMIEHIKNKQIDSKLEFYSSIYQNTNALPQYLLLQIPKSDRQLITKLRVSDHNLNIERGRYTKPKTARELRLCPNCSEIETETHFIIECAKYSRERLELINIFNKNTNDSIDIDTIMNPSNTTESYSLISFIKQSYLLRSSVQ